MSKKACAMDKKEVKKLRSKSAEYQCRKCEETANKEKKLCKPEKIK